MRRKAVGLPAALLVGLAATALLASPALATTSPTDLIVTSPGNGQAVHGARSITVTGEAPVGSFIFVLDDAGHDVGATTTTATTFSIPITFPTTVSYDQFLEVKGRDGKRGLTEQDIEVVFDAPQSDPPVLSAPTTAATVTPPPQPFGDTPMTSISGSGLPGDSILIVATEGSGDNGNEFDDFVQVDADGVWSDQMPLSYGRWSVNAREESADANGYPLNLVSDISNTSVFVLSKQRGLVDQPELRTPAYPADANATVTFFSASPLAKRVAESTAPASRSARFGLTSAVATIAPTASHPFLRDIDATVAPQGAKLNAPSDCIDSGNCTLDQLVVEDGVQVKGIPDAKHPGRLKVTVTGYGPAGDGIQLYANSPTAATSYFQGLYPAYFADQFGTPPGPVTSRLPGWDHQVRVRSTARWSAVVYLKPGPYFVTSFAIRDAGGKHPAYSLASNIDGINVTGKPAK